MVHEVIAQFDVSLFSKNVAQVPTVYPVPEDEYARVGLEGEGEMSVREMEQSAAPVTK